MYILSVTRNAASQFFPGMLLAGNRNTNGDGNGAETETEAVKKQLKRNRTETKWYRNGKDTMEAVTNLWERWKWKKHGGDATTKNVS